MAQFRYVDESGQLQTIELQLEQVTLGRASSCDIVLIDELISREHSRLKRQADGRWVLTDLDSRNRTYVNGQPIKEKVLVPGDVVRLGTKVLEFVDQASGAAAGREIDFWLADREAPAGTVWVKAGSAVTIELDVIERLVGVVEVEAYAETAEMVAEPALAQLAARLEADRGFVALRGEDRRSLQLVAGRLLGGWSRRRIGGVTGDVLGGASELVEALVLSIAAGWF